MAAAAAAAAAESVGDVKLSPDDLIAEGKRHQLCDDPSSSSDCFGQACRLIAAEKGELAAELGPAYLLYGSSLLDLIRQQSTVLGDKLVPGTGEQGDEKEDEGVEGEEESSDSVETTEESEDAAGATAAATAGATATATAAAAAAAASERAEGGDAQPEGKGDDAEKQDQEEGEEEEEEEEDGDRMVAWQVLDTARVILSKSDDKESRYNLAETLKLIGELCIEMENFDGAVEDLQSSLVITKDLEPEHSRLIAELYFTLGQAYSLCMSTKEAIESYEAAINCLKLNVTVQEKTLAEAKENENLDEETRSDVVRRAQRNIDDITALMPDLLSKLEDQQSVAPLAQPTQLDLYTTLMAAGVGFELPSELKQAAASQGLATASASTGVASSSSTSSSATSGAGVTSSTTGSSAATAANGSAAPTRKTMSGQMAKANAPVNNIQHLVRKRKADDESKPEAGSSTGSASAEADSKAAVATDTPAAKRIKPTPVGPPEEPKAETKES